MLTIRMNFDKIRLVENDMREWLSGRASPCQGEGREFESRLALFSFKRESKKINKKDVDNQNEF